MNFDPEITVDSALPGYEDVSFTIHHLTEAKRLKLRMELAKANAQIRDLTVEKEQAGELPLQDQVRIFARIHSEMQEVLDDVITPTWVRHLLVSIRGLTIKGIPATPDSLVELGPRPLYQEIVREVRKQAGLSEKARGESELPTTSNAGAGGQTQIISAPTAAD